MPLHTALRQNTADRQAARRSRASDILLANETTIISPLNGYQYVKVQTVLPADDIDFEPWTNCAVWTNQTAEVYASPQFTARTEEAEDVLTTIHDSGLVGNRTVSLKNVYNVWDYVRLLRQPSAAKAES